jgi:FkbM family methyltransferase
VNTDLARPAAGPEIPAAELVAVTSALLSPGCAATGVVRLGPWELEYVAPRAFAYTLISLFGDRIYDVDPLSTPEVILDGGGWLGLSVLRFRMLFPNARIVVFEPDEDLFAMLCRNLARNGIDNVEPIRAALAGSDGEHTFLATGSDSGTLRATPTGRAVTVPTRRLSPFVDQPVSLLKLNIEGAEAEVIADLDDRLARVDQVLIEYHGFAELPQTLHDILTRLYQAGHTYIISHFNESNRACVPPLRLDPAYRYFLLIYSRRLGSRSAI